MKTFSLRKEDVTHRWFVRSEEHTSELQSRSDLVCRLLLEKKKKTRCKRTLEDWGNSPINYSETHTTASKTEDAAYRQSIRIRTVQNTPHSRRHNKSHTNT